MSATLPQAAIEQMISSLQMPEGCYVRLHTGPPQVTNWPEGYPARAVSWGDVSLSVITAGDMLPGVMELRSGHQRMRVALDEQDGGILQRIDSALEGWEHDAMRWVPDR